MNPLAVELNQILQNENPHLYEMLSQVGKQLFFPKGILTQSAEAKEKAYRFNATIGMATEKGRTMHLPSIMSHIQGFEAEESLTYAPSYGIMPLRQAWQKTIFEKNPSLSGVNLSLPVVTNSITHGLSVMADMWVDPDDVIVLPDKIWGNYNMIFSVRRGAQIVQYPLFNEQGGFNLKNFESCLQSQSKEKKKLIVILNFPNNPTGYTPYPAEAEKIVEILIELADKGTNIVVLSDDAYFGLFYDENILKESIFAKLANQHPRLLAIKLDAATKEYYVWGLRVGFITYSTCLNGEFAPVYDALERKTAGDVRGSISNASHLGQSIILKSLQAKDLSKEKEEKYQIMKKRAWELKRVLEDKKYERAWEVYPFNSGYFMCLKLKTIEAEKLRIHLLDRYGLGVIALGQTDIRIAFSCLEEENIQETFDTILMAVQDLET